MFILSIVDSDQGYNIIQIVFKDSSPAEVWKMDCSRAKEEELP